MWINILRNDFPDIGAPISNNIYKALQIIFQFRSKKPEVGKFEFTNC